MNSPKRKRGRKADAGIARSALLVPAAGGIVVMIALVYWFGTAYASTVAYSRSMATAAAASSTPTISPDIATQSAQGLDKAAYDKKMLQLANNPKPKAASSTSATSTRAASSTPVKTLWPAKAPYPLAGALLPFNRIVAYYGNFYSTGMGVLGATPSDVMIPKLKAAVAQWQAADPSTPVIPAIDYIDVTAQGSAGKDGKYRARMPDDQIDKALDLADQVHGIVILDIQVGLSSVQSELPLLDKYLAMPNVHVALDPEFDMQTSGLPPGHVIGTMSASDINWAANYLAKFVDEDHLPPKILIVHRFTGPMVTHTSQIEPLPEVQIVMDMDGWGSPSKKIGTYNAFIASMPVQFTGFKLFYKNDLIPPSTRMLTPAEILKLTPAPSFIQYQ